MLPKGSYLAGAVCCTYSTIYKFWSSENFEHFLFSNLFKVLMIFIWFAAFGIRDNLSYLPSLRLIIRWLPSSSFFIQISYRNWPDKFAYI